MWYGAHFLTGTFHPRMLLDPTIAGVEAKHMHDPNGMHLRCPLSYQCVYKLCRGTAGQGD
jgi:hypothetical protein